MTTPQNFETIKVLADILETDLGIPKLPPTVFIYNEKWKLPASGQMFILVEFLGSVPFGSRRAYENSPDSSQLLEVQSQNVQETLQIKVWSADPTARMRNHEIMFALNSTYCQQQMEKYAFKIANVPSQFTDISALEASAILNTYAIRFNTLRKYDRSKPVEFYDKFPQSKKPILVNP